MSKYSFEFKLKIILEYLNGKSGGYGSLANKYNLKSNSQVRDWVKIYEQFGEDALRKKMTKTFYSGEFKLRVIQYRHINKCSYRETANHFEIDNPSVIANWQRKYLEEGFEGLNKSIGRPTSMSKADNEKYINKSKNLNELEKEELIKLREENEFLRASLAYEKKLKALIQERAKNKEKTKVIIELRLKFPQIKLKIWLTIAGLPKSSFYEWVQRNNYCSKEKGNKSKS